MAKPVLMVVDDDAAGLEALAGELSDRYGSGYEVVAASAAAAALKDLKALGESAAEVALILAAQHMADMTGIDLLTRAHEIHPAAKRALVVPLGDRSTAEVILRGMALGRIDYYLTKPWIPADDVLHPLVTELLAEWTRTNRPRAAFVSVVGDQWDPRSHELRDLLDRNVVPYEFLDRHSESARARLSAAGVSGDQYPVILLGEATALVQPSNVEIASAFGVKTTADREPCDLAIIGAGPAGLAAAVSASSEGLRTVVAEAEALGGQAGTSSLIRNYLGFPRGLSGADLTQRAYQQAWLFGTDFIFMQRAVALRSDGSRRIVTLADRSELRARAVLIATGVSYRRMDIASIDSLIGAGVFYGAAISEAPAMSGQDVYVVGAGNSAGQAALHLAKYARTVTLLVRGGSLSTSMSEYLIKELERTRNIGVRVRTEVIEGRGDHRLQGLVLRAGDSGAREEVDAVALFVLIGAVPHTDWLGAALARDEHGYILTGTDLRDESSQEYRPLKRTPFLFETSLPGVFAVGDVRHRSVKRVASAAGEGSVAVSLVHRYLAGR